MIDWSRVDELRVEIGEAGFAEVVELFLDEVETVLGRLGQGKAGAALADELHFLKGCAWNIGFREFGAVCHDAEKRAARGGAPAPDIGHILDSYAGSRAAFLARLNDRAAPSAA